jgi:hypothetical protein
MARAGKKTSVVLAGIPATRGERMTKGAWRLANKSNNKVFVGSLVDTINIGKHRLAIFSVPK